MRSTRNSPISEPISRAISAGLEGAIPAAALTLSQWAEQYRVVSMERVADPALAGPWRNDRTPYLVGIMDAITDPAVNEVVFVKSAQVGGTEIGCNAIGYYIHIDPATIAYICENEGKARAWSTEAFAPMLRDTPVLADVMAVAKQRDSANQIESKMFRGGHFALGWATSPATLSSRPRRVLIRDEIDAFSATKEGDPIELSEARTKTAGAQRKIIDISTPRDEETTVIWPRYLNSTRERYFVPCPHCEEMQVLEWRDPETGTRNVRWDEDAPETAYYLCRHCGAAIEEDDKPWMIARGKWISTHPDYAGVRRGFWLNELYSPFSTWADMAKAYLEAKGRPEKLRVFVNTRLAELWRSGSGDKIDPVDLQFAREDYPAEVPAGVIVLFAGVDVQDDRLECEVVGWGLDGESWSIAYRVFHGDPGKRDVWTDLKDFLTRDFLDEEGIAYQIRAAVIDSGGHHTQQVYDFCKRNAGRRFWAGKGANTPGKPIAGRPSQTKTGKLYIIGTEAAKDAIFSALKTEEPGPGFCHFPSDREQWYFTGLCSEKRITKFVNGRTRTFYVKISDSVRNEPLDCRVYALAAYTIYNPDLKAQLNRLRRLRAETDESAPVEPRESFYPRKNNNPEKNTIVKTNRKGFVSGGSRRRGGFVNGWK